MMTDRTAFTGKGIDRVGFFDPDGFEAAVLLAQTTFDAKIRVDFRFGQTIKICTDRLTGPTGDQVQVGSFNIAIGVGSGI